MFRLRRDAVETPSSTIAMEFAFGPTTIGISGVKPSVSGEAAVAQSAQMNPVTRFAGRREANHGVPGPSRVPQTAQSDKSSPIARWYTVHRLFALSR